MMELIATGRKARSRRFTCEQLANGLGILIMDAADFDRPVRDRLCGEIVAAYESGKLQGEVLDLAHRVANAMSAPCSTLEALRWHLQADGREMVARICMVATQVPALSALVNWIAI